MYQNHVLNSVPKVEKKSLFCIILVSNLHFILLENTVARFFLLIHTPRSHGRFSRRPRTQDKTKIAVAVR